MTARGTVVLQNNNFHTEGHDTAPNVNAYTRH